MTWLTKLYNWLKSLSLPGWINDWLKYILDKILIPVLKQVGQEVINTIQTKVFEAAKHDEWSGKQKLEWVFSECRSIFNMESLSNRMLNLLIELVVNQLKTQKIIL